MTERHVKARKRRHQQREESFAEAQALRLNSPQADEAIRLVTSKHSIENDPHTTSKTSKSIGKSSASGVSPVAISSLSASSLTEHNGLGYDSSSPRNPIHIDSLSTSPRYPGTAYSPPLANAIATSTSRAARTAASAPAGDDTLLGRGPSPKSTRHVNTKLNNTTAVHGRERSASELASEERISSAFRSVLGRVDRVWTTMRSKKDKATVPLFEPMLPTRNRTTPTLSNIEIAALPPTSPPRLRPHFILKSTSASGTIRGLKPEYLHFSSSSNIENMNLKDLLSDSSFDSDKTEESWDSISEQSYMYSTDDEAAWIDDIIEPHPLDPIYFNDETKVEVNLAILTPIGWLSGASASSHTLSPSSTPSDSTPSKKSKKSKTTDSSTTSSARPKKEGSSARSGTGHANTLRPKKSTDLVELLDTPVGTTLPKPKKKRRAALDDTNVPSENSLQITKTSKKSRKVLDQAPEIIVDNVTSENHACDTKNTTEEKTKRKRTKESNETRKKSSKTTEAGVNEPETVEPVKSSSKTKEHTPDSTTDSTHDTKRKRDKTFKRQAEPTSTEDSVSESIQTVVAEGSPTTPEPSASTKSSKKKEVDTITIENPITPTEGEVKRKKKKKSREPIVPVLIIVAPVPVSETRSLLLANSSPRSLNSSSELGLSPRSPGLQVIVQDPSEPIVRSPSWNMGQKPPRTPPASPLPIKA